MPILRCPCGHRLPVDSTATAATCPACGGKIRVRKGAASLSGRTEVLPPTRRGAGQPGETVALEDGRLAPPPSPAEADPQATLAPQPAADADVTLGDDLGEDEVSDSG